ncbi:MAG: DUF5665 domain-containing protein [Clostridiales bacterium]
MDQKKSPLENEAALLAEMEKALQDKICVAPVNALKKAEEQVEAESKAVEEQRAVVEKAIGQLEAFALRLEQSKIAEYMDYLSKPGRLIRMNFLMGAARGFGFAVGLTVLGAVIIYFLQYLVRLNLPVISKFIADIFVLANQYLEYRR